MSQIPSHMVAFLHRLGWVRPNGSGYMARCPAHEDREPSLSIDLGDDGRILLHCFAGCSTEAVLQALGMSFSDVMPPDSVGGGRSNMPHVQAKTTIYEYHDVNEEVAYRIVRIDGRSGKRIYAERPDGSGGWIRNLDGVKRVLYRLPDVERARLKHQRIYIVEGEKNADDLRALGLTATTNPGGAGKWNSFGNGYSQALDRAYVIVLYDNDTPGRRHRDDIVQALKGIANSVRVVDLPGLGDGEDVSDWLARGGTREELERLADEAEKRPLPPDLIPGMRVLRASEVEPVKVEWLWPGYLAKGKIAIADGNPGDGKSTVALDLVARLSTGGAMPDGHSLQGPANAVVMSAEDGVADTIVPRLTAAGADLSRVYVFTEMIEGKTGRPPELPLDIERLRELVVAYNAELVVVDPLMAYLSPTIDAHRDQDVRRAMTPLKAMAEETGAAILVIRHCSKSQGMSAIHKGGGSVGIIGAARIGWLFAPDPNAPPDVRRLVIAVTKSNLGMIPPALLYHTEHDEAGACGRVVWEGTSAWAADDLTGPPPDAAERGALQEAMGFLETLLEAGPVAAKEVAKQAEAAGISEKTLRRAKSAIKAASGRDGSGGSEWKWRLPDHPP